MTTEVTWRCDWCRERIIYRRPEVGVCPQCWHETAHHGTGYVEIGGQRVMVMVCLDCPRNTCLINPVR